jgi:flavin-binding protein dodecin
MSVARITEIKSTSSKSFDDAVQVGLARANKTLKNVKGAWVKEMDVACGKGGKIAEYRVLLKVTFVLE